MATQPQQAAREPREESIGSANLIADGTLQDIVDLNLEETVGSRVYFMPVIKENLERHPELTTPLCEKLKVPPFFFEHPGWNANGFYGSFDTVLHPGTNQGPIFHTAYFRFLTKRTKTLSEEERAREMERLVRIDSRTKPTEVPHIAYDWDYLGFISVTRVYWDGSKWDGPNMLQILLCFDLMDSAKEVLRTSLERFDSDLASVPFGLVKTALDFVTLRYEEAVWMLRPLIRDKIEKERLAVQYVRNSEVFGSTAQEQLETLATHFDTMYEVSRHCIHVTETLSVACKTVQRLIEDQKLLCYEPLQNSRLEVREKNIPRLVKSGLEFSASLLSNYQDRADAFAKRLNGETQLAFNSVAISDSKAIKSILLKTSEGKKLVDTVTVLTLLFLPGTFITGFFGMNFFAVSTKRRDSHDDWVALTQIWIFFACTIPITLLAVAIWKWELVEWCRKHIFTPLTQGRARGDQTNQSGQKPIHLQSLTSSSSQNQNGTLV